MQTPWFRFWFRFYNQKTRFTTSYSNAARTQHTFSFRPHCVHCRRVAMRSYSLEMDALLTRRHRGATRSPPLAFACMRTRTTRREILFILAITKPRVSQIRISFILTSGSCYCAPRLVFTMKWCVQLPLHRLVQPRAYPRFPPRI